MTYTTNYQLPQWVKSDRIMMDDFNNANQKLDTALKSQADTLAQHAQALLEVGNCIFYTTTYTGTGGQGSGSRNSLTFPHTPYFVAVTGENRGHILLFRGANAYANIGAGANYHGAVSWSGKTVYWYTGSGHVNAQMNESGVTYQVLALLAADE